MKHRRGAFLALGFLFVALAAIGVALPLVPTTPFLLVAAACFARSSERWHQWLLSSRTFGPTIRDWEQHRCMPWRAKVLGILVMVLVGGASILFAVRGTALRLLGVALIAAGVLVVARIPVCPRRRQTPNLPGDSAAGPAAGDHAADGPDSQRSSTRADQERPCTRRP